MAASVLIVGLLGITAMLSRGAGAAKDGSKDIVAATIAQEALDRFTQARFENIAGLALTPDASLGQIQIDKLKFDPRVTVFDRGDGGLRVLEVELSVDYTDSVGRTRTVRVTSIMPEVPDANL